jgi:hypothetical protein
VERRGGHVRLVQLLCETEVNLQHLQNTSRAEQGKLTSVEIFKDFLASRDLATPIPGRPTLTIEISELQPSDAAERIASHYSL